MDDSTLPFPEVRFTAYDLVQPDRLREAGCFTSLPVRINRRDDLANAGMKRAYFDFSKATNTEVQNYVGCISSDGGNVISLAYGDILPERIAPMAYLAELGFLHDDYTEHKDIEETVGVHGRLDYALDPTNMNSPDNLPSSLQMKKIFSASVLECLEIDTQPGLLLMKSYSEQWLKVVDTTPIPFSSLEEYIEHRIKDSGALVLTWQVAFGQNTPMSEEDYMMLEPLFKATMRAMLLTNDFYSWRKEKTQPHHRIANAVLFYIKSGLSEQEALNQVKQMILEKEAVFLDEQRGFCEAHPNLPWQLKKLVNVLQHAIGGYHYWCAICPRYNCPGVQGPPSASSGIMKREALSRDDSITTENTISEMERQCIAQADENILITGKPSLDRSALEAPIDYTQSMSSKNVRLQLIDAFSLWLPLPPSALCAIKDVINFLHNSSLMIDDIQDGSLLRRGETATHVIFGQAQTINSATYMFVQATKIIHYLHNPALITVMIEELENLFIGQSWELRWRSTMCCPSENEYFAMVDHKTGSMFRMLLRLMLTMGESEVNNNVFDSLSRVMGRWYQVRDDYLNLVGTEYTKKKGFCEDLDEGKFSYPVIRCCANAATRDIILGIIQRRNLPNLPVESKLQALRLMEKTGVIRATWDLVMKLQKEIEEEIGRLEVIFGEENPIFRLLIKVLADIPRPGSGSR